MKICSKCGSTYRDDAQTFCTDDGTPLATMPDPDATLLMTPNPPPPTVILPQPYSVPTVTVRQSNPVTYIIIALLALIAGGAVVALVLRNDNNQPAANNNIPAATNPPKETNPSAPNRPASQPPGQPQKVQPNPAPQAPPNLPPLTDTDAQNLIARWAAAQNSHAFAVYQDCYDTAFQGIKRTTKGSAQVFNYAQWMNDRRKMFPKTASVELAGTSVTINGETATVEFEQTYRSANYCDIGQKTLRIRQTVNGPKIVSEELKAPVPCG